jgi:hypothetical protein
VPGLLAGVQPPWRASSLRMTRTASAAATMSRTLEATSSQSAARVWARVLDTAPSRPTKLPAALEMMKRSHQARISPGTVRRALLSRVVERSWGSLAVQASPTTW